jgi:hypothetical protein
LRQHQHQHYSRQRPSGVSQHMRRW